MPGLEGVKPNHGMTNGMLRHIIAVPNTHVSIEVLFEPASTLRLLGTDLFERAGSQPLAGTEQSISTPYGEAFSGISGRFQLHSLLR